ncbi:MAG TPA: hypothetical protein V6D14_12630 [Coleofasciculaceae cyanobacterium]
MLYLPADYHYQKSAISDRIPVFLQNWHAPVEVGHVATSVSLYSGLQETLERLFSREEDIAFPFER